jgi:hypothetical protein
MGMTKAKNLKTGMHVANIGHVSRVHVTGVGVFVWFDNGKVRNYSHDKDVTVV